MTVGEFYDMYIGKFYGIAGKLMIGMLEKFME